MLPLPFNLRRTVLGLELVLLLHNRVNSICFDSILIFVLDHFNFAYVSYFLVPV